MDEATKAELIEKYRHINVEWEDWYEFVCDDFKIGMRDKGVDIDQIYFTGFWSQGDGACFEATISNNDWHPLMCELGYDPDGADRVMCEYLFENGYLNVYHSGHYNHHKSVSYRDDIPDPENFGEEAFIDLYAPPNCEDSDLKATAWFQILCGSFRMPEFVDQVTDYLEDKMKELYDRLYKEYEHLTSDEAVWDAIVANEIHLTEEKAA